MRPRFTPDFDKVSPEDFDFRKRAQYLVQLLVERDLPPQEYKELVELVESQLYEVVQEALARAGAVKQAHARELHEQTARPTRRPPSVDALSAQKTPVKTPVKTPAKESPTPSIELDWSETDETK